MTNAKTKYLPMFEAHDIQWLVDKLPYSEFYLTAVKYRQKPVTGRFRRVCAKTLHCPEAELFGAEVTP